MATNVINVFKTSVTAGYSVLCRTKLFCHKQIYAWGSAVVVKYTNGSGSRSKGDTVKGTIEKPPSAPETTSDPSDPSKYNTPEYFNHNIMSFYDIELDFQKYRLPQPSSKAAIGS